MNAADALDILTSTTVYGIFHDAADDPLIYVGATRDPLSRRLDYHRSKARSGGSAPIHTYIREEVAAPVDTLSIEKLPYDDEQTAIDALGDGTLNVQGAIDGHHYEWTRPEVELLITTIEEKNLRAAQKRLSANETQVRNAALRLDLIDPRDYTRVDWDEWDEKLGTMPDRELAEEIGCSKPNVARRRRELGIRPAKTSLTDEEVLEIWIRYHLDDDATYPSVAKTMEEVHSGIHSLSDQTVGAIIRRDTHTDLTLPSPAAIAAANAYIEARARFREAESQDAV